MIVTRQMRADERKKGAIGYVEFVLMNQPVLILCEIFDIKEGRVEVIVIAGAKVCIWIKNEQILICENR